MKLVFQVPPPCLRRKTRRVLLRPLPPSEVLPLFSRVNTPPPCQGLSGGGGRGGALLPRLAVCSLSSRARGEEENFVVCMATHAEGGRQKGRTLNDKKILKFVKWGGGRGKKEAKDGQKSEGRRRQAQARKGASFLFIFLLA